MTSQSLGDLSRRLLSRLPYSRPTKRRDGFLLSVVPLILLGWPMLAQQDPTFSTDVKVVNVFATVRNKKGEIINNLTKDDFDLQEDGRPETIRYFTRENDLPLTLGLLVDTSGSQLRVLDEERSASYTFLDKVLREDKDLAFVIQFERNVDLLQDLTSSRKLLQAGLDALRPPEMRMPQWGGGNGPIGTSPGGGGAGGPGGGSRRRGGMMGGTALYDAVYLASDELMKKQSGRKALIVLSDGVDNASKVSLDTAIETTQRSDTLIYAILFSDSQAYGGGGGIGGPTWGGLGGGGMGRRGGGGRRFPQQQMHPDGKKVLERMSRETGGRLFEVSKKEPIEQIYSSIQEELRNQYSLGYSPELSAAGPGYRKIHLVAKQKDLVVQTRDGYYAQR